MFGSLLINLQSLISSRFLVGSFFPVLAFWVANGAMLFVLNAPFHDYVVSGRSAETEMSAFILSIVLVAIAFSAYAEAALLPAIQYLMEGNWQSGVTSFFVPAQTALYDRIQDEIAENSSARGTFGHRSCEQLAGLWTGTLAGAANVGSGKGSTFDARTADSARQVAALEASVQPTDDQITFVVVALARDLVAHDPFVPVGAPLKQLWDRLDHVIKQATKERRARPELFEVMLRSARMIGRRLNPNSLASDISARPELKRLAARRLKSLPIAGDDIARAVTLLCNDLKRHDANAKDEEGDAPLDLAQKQVLALMEYATQYAASRYRSLVNRAHFDFGAFPLAGTRMGNIARSVSEYAYQRYRLNFELFWPRLQLFAQKDKEFGAMLQGAQTQLDFLVSCSALTLFWTILWSVWLAVSQGPGYLFLGVALLGPGAAYILYCVAVAQYRTLANILRSAVDLYRFDLLESLHHGKPSSVGGESELWSNIDALHALYEIRDLKYEPKA